MDVTTTIKECQSMQEVSVFKCPICHATLPTIKAPNGIPRKTCGQRACIRAMKYKGAVHADYFCPYCKQNKNIPFRPGRKTCGDRKCIEANKNKNRDIRGRVSKPKDSNDIDLFPVEDLKKEFPKFYDLLRINPMKQRSCVKCGTIFKSIGYRTCAECRFANAQYGLRAALI